MGFRQGLDKTESSVMEKDTLKKYRLAGYGFLGLNLIYIAIFFVFIPPFFIDLAKGVLYAISFVVLFGALAVFVSMGYRKLAIVLAAIYALRSAFSIYTLVMGEAFAAVPFVLPCLLLTFYLLGRAAWNWP